MTAHNLPSDPVYHADLPGGVRLIALDGVTALYHRRSGLTHVVAEPVPQILAALEAGPLTAAGLLAALSAGADVQAEGDALAALTDRLSELAALGLVDAR